MFLRKLFVTLILVCFACSQQPPQAEKIPKVLEKHGQQRIDNYFWLNERDNPKVLQHLEAENAYLKAQMQPTEKLQARLYQEIIGRIKPDDNTVPYLDHGYYYYVRYTAGQEYPIYCRKKGDLNAAEEIMLNVNELAQGHAYYHVGGLTVSDDNQWLAFGVDTVSRRMYTLQFKNLSTGQMLTPNLVNTSANYTWAADNQTIFYVTKDSTLRPFQVWRYRRGDDAQTRAPIYSEKDHTYNIYLSRSKSREYLFLIAAQTLATEYRYLKATDPNGNFTILQPRAREHEYQVWQHENKFYIRTNWKAKNFCLMETPIQQPAQKNWRLVIPHRADVLLESIETFKDFLVLSERKNGLVQIRVIHQKQPGEHYLDFGEQAYVAYPQDNHELNTTQLRFAYSSLTTPNSVYDYDLLTRVKTLRKQDEVVGGYNPQDYYTERLFAPARDCVKVPISLVYKKGFQKNGQGPCLLYGYGSYGASMDPDFNAELLSLLNRGFVYAIAHIRGGEEMGRAWYEQGKLLHKKNTFYDFIDGAEFLIRTGYTSKAKLAIMGESAGGLLIGAVINLRPDLCQAAIAGVPWVDVVTTMLDESIPLTTAEYDEWGNPNDKTYYDYMLSYSPYDNVAAQAYPAMLVTTGLHDSQVQYFEPTKWVAKLRELKTDHNLLLLDVDMETGHGGATGRFKRYQRTAREYTFLLEQLDVKP